MKKSLVFMIAVLLVGALMISCNSEVAGNAAGDGKVVTVGVNLDNSSKALQTSVSNATDASGLYWFYTATKTDGSLFITGQTTEKTAAKTSNSTHVTGLQGAILGQFSTGGWTFSFWGYTSKDSIDSPTNKPVYQCEDLAVTITADTNLNVTIEAGDGMGAAKLVFNSPTWTYAKAPNGTSLTLKVYDVTVVNNVENVVLIATDTAATDSEGKATFSNHPNDLTLSAGSHTLTFNVFYGSEQVGQATLSVVAKNGTTITVSGSIENLDSLYTVTVATVTNTVAVSDEISSVEVTEVTAAVTPASASAVTQQEVTNTKVTFAEGVLASEDTTSVTNQKTVTSSVLTMDVSSLADANANTGFTVVSGSAVAAIDLNLTKTTRIYDTTNATEVLKSETATNVPTFEDYVTVETYIAKGLSEVYVLYNGYVASVAGKEHAIASENANHQTDGMADMYDANANPTNPIGSRLGYDKATGLLRFKTKHFSEFYVKCADEAYNATLGKAYATLTGALTAEELADNHTIMLLKDIPSNTFSGAAIYKSITLDGNNHTIHGAGIGYIGADAAGTKVVNRTGVLVVNGTNASSFTMKNVTIDSATQMGVVVTDGIKSLSLDNCTIICTGSSSPSPVILDRVKLNSNGINNGCIQTEQSGCKITVNDSILKVSSAGSGYALKMYLPVVGDSEIKDSTLAAWSCVYNKLGSMGSVLKLNNCQLYSVNKSKGATNEFYMAGIETIDVSYDFENCKMHAASTDITNVAYQSLFCVAPYNGAKNFRVYIHGSNTTVDNNVSTIYESISPSSIIKPHVFDATVNKIDGVSTFEIKIEKSLKSMFDNAAVMGSTYAWTEDGSYSYVSPITDTSYNIFGIKYIDIGSGTAWYVEPIEASNEAVTAAINDNSIIRIVGGYFDTGSPYSIIEESKPSITPSGYEWVQFDNWNSMNYLGYHLELVSAQ